MERMATLQVNPPSTTAKIRPYRPRIRGSPLQSRPIPPRSPDPGPAGGVRETHEIPGALLPPWRQVWLEV